MDLHLLILIRQLIEHTIVAGVMTDKLRRMTVVSKYADANQDTIQVKSHGTHLVISAQRENIPQHIQ